MFERRLLSGNEALAQAARDCGVTLGTGYPGTPSTEILEHFEALGGRAQWAPNEKVALEVGLGAALGGAAALVAMKHVGLNVAADPLFTAAYTGTAGPLVIVSADDPGMASSQNEQDNRRYAVAAAVPMLEPADSQESYDFLAAALELSDRWRLPVLLRTTTRVCHSKTVLVSDGVAGLRRQPHFQRDISGRVMIPANARPAHRRLREKLARLAEWSEASTLNRIVEGDGRLGIITSGVAFMHVREAAPEASVLKLGLSYPLPLKKIARFAAGVQRCVVIEEGDPYLVEQLRAAGIAVEGKAEMYRFGELDVARVRRILAGDCTPEPPPARGNPPALCTGCPHRATFAVLKRLDCIVAGDIGCYSLGVLPPLEAMDTLVCMGASIGVGLGLRHVLPNEQARRVVSVIGDSTFVHSGITGLVEMVYNRPATGHVVLILDNGTTAMTGLQEHPGTGRSLGHQPAAKIVYEDLARALGVGRVFVVDPLAQPEEFERLLQESLAGSELTVIIVRRTCLLAAGKIKRYAAACADGKGASDEVRSKMEALPESPAKGERTGATVGLPNRVLCTAGQASSGTKAVASCAKPVTNVIIAGLGGQGVLTASDILAEAAFAAGLDVKKADVHGMSQRGGSVRSDVRFGAEVLSPMVPPGEAHFLVVLSDGQSDTHRAMLRADGRLIDAQAIGRAALPNRRSLNVALLGLLSRHLEIEPDIWQEAIRRNLKAEWHDDNLRAFHMGREAKREGLGIRD